MLTLSTHTPAHPWLFFRVWIAEHVDNFLSRYDTKSMLLTNRLIGSNDDIIKYLNIQREKARLLPPHLAKDKLKRLKRELRTYENIARYISRSSNIPLKNSFRLLVKEGYKYEARLHTVAYSDVPIIETPEYIKQGLSELGKRSLNKSHSDNAFS